jgi:hypothetical protein
MSEKFEDKLKTVIQCLSQSITCDVLDNHRETIEKLRALHDENPYRFLELLEHARFEIDTIIENVFQIPEQKNKYIIKFIANGLYEHFHETRIQKLEGSPCCADKSSFVRDMTLKALKSSQNLSLFADYTNVKEITEHKERRAYWSPVSLKDTDEAMQLFWDWYGLKHQNPPSN